MAVFFVVENGPERDRRRLTGREFFLCPVTEHLLKNLTIFVFDDYSIKMKFAIITQIMNYDKISYDPSIRRANDATALTAITTTATPTKRVVDFNI